MIERMEKINELVKHEISRQLLTLFPDEIISVTKVDVSRDLSYAKVWVSSLSNSEQTARRCQDEAPQITNRLSKSLILKKVPKITFIADKTLKNVEQIEKLIDRIHKE